MKTKFILIPIFLLFSCSLFSQNNMRDINIKKSKSTECYANNIPENRTLLKSNQSNRLYDSIISVINISDDLSGDLYKKTSYEYDNNGNRIVKYFFSWSDILNKWDTTYIVQYYRSIHVDFDSAYVHSFDNGNYSFLQKEIKLYDHENKLSKLYVIDNFSDTIQIEEYYYNTNNLKDSVVFFYEYDGDLVEYFLDLYYYDDFGSDTLVETWYNDAYVGVDWSYLYIKTLKYYDNNQLNYEIIVDNYDTTITNKVYVYDTFEPTTLLAVIHSDYFSGTDSTTQIDYYYYRPIYVESISFSKNEIQLARFDTETLYLNIFPNNADEDIFISIEDSTIVSYSDDIVTGLKQGSTNIVAKTSEGLTASCNVTVGTTSNVDISNVSNISVYPQMFHNEIRINNIGNNTLSVRILSLNGTVIHSNEYSDGSISIQLGHLNSGFYLIYLKNSKGTIIEKIIKI